MMDPGWSETWWSNFNVWFILEFHITQILISMTSRFECISWLIKVTYKFDVPNTRSYHNNTDRNAAIRIHTASLTQVSQAMTEAMCSHHQQYMHLHLLSHQVLHCYINWKAFCYVQHSPEHLIILTQLSLHQHSTNPGHQVAMPPIQFVIVCGISEDYIINCVLCHLKMPIQTAHCYYTPHSLLPTKSLQHST
jgi:hypothetical protein